MDVVCCLPMVLPLQCEWFCPSATLTPAIHLSVYLPDFVNFFSFLLQHYNNRWLFIDSCLENSIEYTWINDNTHTSWKIQSRTRYQSLGFRRLLLLHLLLDPINGLLLSGMDRVGKERYISILEGYSLPAIKYRGWLIPFPTGDGSRLGPIRITSLFGCLG